MRTLTAIAVAADLLSGPMLANAQNTTPTTKVSPSPSNINKGNASSKTSGEEAPAAAASRARVSGAGKFCRPTAANGPLSCRYATLNACRKHNKSSSLHCVANPDTHT
jgi:hypothetical protein